MQPSSSSSFSASSAASSASAWEGTSSGRRDTRPMWSSANNSSGADAWAQMQPSSSSSAAAAASRASSATVSASTARQTARMAVPRDIDSYSPPHLPAVFFQCKTSDFVSRATETAVHQCTGPPCKLVTKAAHAV